MRTFLVVGAGLAGVSAAAALRASGFDGRVAVAGTEPHQPYDRPPLSKELLKGQAPVDQIALQSEDFYRNHDIELVLGTTVTSIRPQEQTAVISTGQPLLIDKVLLCTGGRARRLDVPGSDLDGVHHLRNLDDALAIRDQLAANTSVVVVGAGFIGAEVASVASELGCRVTMLTLEQEPLSRALGVRVGRIYANLHRSHGVDVETNVGVARVNGPGRVREIETTDGRTIPAELVVVGIGIVPRSELGLTAGLVVDNGIVVNEFGQTSIDGIYAAGDVANRHDPLTGLQVRDEHWQTAQRHAEATARSMCDDRRPFGEVPWYWSDQYGVNLQVAGRAGVNDEMLTRGDPEGLRFTAIYHDQGRLTAAAGVNSPRDVRAVTRLIESGAVVAPDTLAGAEVDLRELAGRMS